VRHLAVLQFERQCIRVPAARRGGRELSGNVHRWPDTEANPGAADSGTTAAAIAADASSSNTSAAADPSTADTADAEAGTRSSNSRSDTSTVLQHQLGLRSMYFRQQQQPCVFSPVLSLH
jgi:hypothetical protein